MKYKFILLLIGIYISPLIIASDEQPITPYLWEKSFTFETISNLQGGVSEGTRGLANVDVMLTIDTKSAGWWDKGTWFIYALGDYGRNPSDLTGDLQAVSNISADDSVKIYQFWYNQNIFNNHVNLLVGLHDFNSTFYSLESAGLFNMASFGIGSEVAQVTPSIFPTASLTLHLTLNFDQFYMLLASYDGVTGDPDNPRGTHIMLNKDDGLFNAVEIGLNEEGNYKIAIGGWQHTAKVINPINGYLMDFNSGFYSIGEKRLSEKVRIFVQYGIADEMKNQLDEYIGAGVTRSDNFKNGDAWGLAFGSTTNGTPFLSNNLPLKKRETILELTYLSPITKNVHGQTSLYFIDNPGMSQVLENALALSLRLYMDF